MSISVGLSPTTGTTGTRVTISMTPEIESVAYYKIQARRYGTESPVQTVASRVNKSTSGYTTTYNWTMPASVLNLAAPTGTSFPLEVLVYSYNSSGRYLEFGNGLMTVTIPSSAIPSVTSVTPSDTRGHLATYGGYVQGKSVLQVAVVGQGVYNSTITGYDTTYDSVTKSGATTTFNTNVAGTRTISAKVTDSRGRTSSAKTASITVLAYSNPQITSVSADRVDTSGNPDPTGAQIKVSAEGTVASLNNHNTKVFKIRYRRVGTSTWSTWTTADTTTFAANVDYAYDIQVQLADDFTNVTVARQVPGTFVLVDYGGMEGVEGTGIAFGAAATKANTFLNYLTLESYGTVLVGAAPNRGWAGIQFKTGSYTSLGIRAYDNGTAYGNNMLIQSGGLLIMGSGEYAANRYALSDLQGQDLEQTYIGSDSQVIIETNGGTIANRKTFTFGNGGDLWMPKDGRVWVDSSVIDISATSRASRVTTSGITLRDKNENVVGNVSAEQLANGATGLLLSARRGSTYNAISLRVANDGTREVYVDAPRAWRKAIQTPQVQISDSNATTFTATPPARQVSGASTWRLVLLITNYGMDIVRYNDTNTTVNVVHIAGTAPTVTKTAGATGVLTATYSAVRSGGVRWLFLD